jgi:hypothetical protein
MTQQHPMAFLVDRANDPRAVPMPMDWPDNADPRGAWMESQPTLRQLNSQRGSGGIHAVNGKAAGSTSLAKSLDLALAHKDELGQGLFQDFVAMRDRRADILKQEDGRRAWRNWLASGVHRDLVRRIERCPAGSDVKAELLASIA